MKMCCPSCGANARAGCNCGVDYVPAGEYAAQQVAKPENREKSNRMLADEIGVSKDTVRTARKVGGEKSPPEKRVGRDGKKQSATKKKSKRQQGGGTATVPTACTTIDPERHHDEGDPPEKIWKTQFDYRVRETTRMAKESLEELPNGLKVTKAMIDAAQHVALAWQRLTDKLAQRHARNGDSK